MNHFGVFLTVFVSFFFFVQTAGASGSCKSKLKSGLTSLQEDFKEGDLIFISSSSAQSDMLQEATKSIWTHVGVLVKRNGKLGVVEASAKVQWTPLDQFIAKSRGHQVSVKRLDQARCQKLVEKQVAGAPRTCNVEQNIESLKKELGAMIGKPYDIKFLPGDDKIYCSELSQKAYERAFGIKIGVEQPFAEVLGITDGGSWENLPQSSLVRETIVKRFDGGKTFNPLTPAVSPISQYKSDLLSEVYECQEKVQPELGSQARKHE